MFIAGTLMAIAVTRVHYSTIVKQFMALQNNEKLIRMHHQVSTKGVNFLRIFYLILK